MNENKIELSGIFSNGYGIIPKKLMQSKDINIYDKCILAYMLSFSGGGNVCFPSYAKIQEDLGISRPTISKTLKKLQEKGYIKISKLYPSDPLKHNNKYILSFLNEQTIVNEINSRGEPDELPQLAKLTSNNNILNNNILNNNSITPEISSKNIKKKIEKNTFEIPTLEQTKEILKVYKAYKKLDFSVSDNAFNIYSYYENHDWCKANGEKLKDWKRTVNDWILRGVQRGTIKKDTYTRI